MNLSYGSHTVTLVSLCVPFVSQNNKQNSFKNECSQLQLDGGGGGIGEVIAKYIYIYIAV